MLFGDREDKGACPDKQLTNETDDEPTLPRVRDIPQSRPDPSQTDFSAGSTIWNIRFPSGPQPSVPFDD